jgi:hypothetical protein
MDTSNSSQELSPLKSLFTGFLISMSLTLFLYFGLSLSCKYLVQITLSLISLIIISSFIFWINLKHDYMSDLINITSSTVAFDFRFSRSKHVISISNFLKRINPYIGAIGTIAGLLLLLWIIPALLITLLSSPESFDRYIYLAVFLLNILICSSYVHSNRDQLNMFTSKAFFFSGVMLGAFGLHQILLIIFP